jgi:hypothetical protein
MRNMRMRRSPYDHFWGDLQRVIVLAGVGTAGFGPNGWVKGFPAAWAKGLGQVTAGAEGLRLPAAGGEGSTQPAA